jgi:hypothetical protein
MLSNVLALVSWVWGKKSWLVAGLAALLLASMAWAYVQGLRLDAVRAELSAEQSAHSLTRAALDLSLHQTEELRIALAYAHNSTAAVQGSLRDALAREAEAVSAAAARKQILDQVRTRVRTETERMEVVDDATRDAVAARLNQPL